MQDAERMAGTQEELREVLVIRRRTEKGRI